MWGSISVLISLVFSMWCAFFVQVAISTFCALIFLVFNYSIRTMATVLPCIFMYKPRCQFLCPNLLSFQYVYSGQSNKASFSCFFCAHGNVTSGALISLVFQYIYWHHTNAASLVFFSSEWHVNSCPMIFLLFSTSIRVIVTMLSFFSKIVQYVYLCHNNCVSFLCFLHVSAKFFML